MFQFLDLVRCLSIGLIDTYLCDVPGKPLVQYQISVQFEDQHMISHSFIGASLSEPHTSELNSTNVMVVPFTNKYVKNQITYIQVHEELPEQFTDTPYKAGTCTTVVRHMKNYLRSLLALYIRLVRVLRSFIT